MISSENSSGVLLLAELAPTLPAEVLGCWNPVKEIRRHIAKPGYVLTLEGKEEYGTLFPSTDVLAFAFDKSPAGKLVKELLELVGLPSEAKDNSQYMPYVKLSLNKYVVFGYDLVSRDQGTVLVTLPKGAEEELQVHYFSFSPSAKKK